MQSLRIILVCVVVAVAYGIAHDLVTAHVCVEYFTIGHPRIFDTEDPTLLALGWGVIATWWVGLGLGILLAVCARAGQRPKRDARSLRRPIAILIAVMAACAAVAGVVGFFLARSGAVVLIGPLVDAVPADRHDRFIADLWSHSASYGVAIIGGIVLAVRVWRSRAVV